MKANSLISDKNIITGEEEVEGGWRILQNK